MIFLGLFLEDYMMIRESLESFSNRFEIPDMLEFFKKFILNLEDFNADIRKFVIPSIFIKLFFKIFLFFSLGMHLVNSLETIS
ncbi:MAG: hypothetical protein ACXABO_00120 [Promethearchaeota archaeon]|jgi:hypothetical protein